MQMKNILLIHNNAYSHKRRSKKHYHLYSQEQGANTARELVGWQRELYLPYKENYAALATTFEYTRSRETCGIAKHLFSTNRLTFSGSEYTPLPGSDFPQENPLIS